MEILSPPQVLLNNPFRDYFLNIKKQMISQKLISEFNLVGKQAYLVENVKKLSELEQAIKRFGIHYKKSEKTKTLWWGKTYKIIYINVNGKIFYYIPNLTFDENGTKNVGKAVVSALKGIPQKLNLDIEENKTLKTILKRYGVEIK
ncbi:hypothetical protein JYK00_04910 [Thermosipho ferrireducens]|uniref:Uncharacterized protein n=1 Tax=Thermosipho ferrireducens TaxID=2571116 RepID=A0ABX7S760_9BACT|nr:hypothetical protein [Thermosipho ferrireducens]QTA37098.1 hypothetical protein JYK00_04910 [Thermosipho ferrireducens]